jgi:hypothetical protein
MATQTPMKLADMIVPEVFHSYTQQLSTEKTSFWSSGVVTNMSDIVDGLGGTTVHMPFFNDLDGDDEIMDDTQDLSIAKTSVGMDIATRLYRAKVYGGTDLAADLAGADPMNVIINRFGEWWARKMQATLLSAVAGATAAMKAETANSTNHNSASPNNLDITGLTGAAAVFDAESFIDAAQRLGDASDGMGAIAVHSATYALMRKQDLIDFIRASETEPAIPYYMGKRVIVNDVMPYNAGTGVATTYIFGQGVIGYVEKAPKTPVEPWRDPLKNGGTEMLIQRRQFVLHPRGIKWVGTPASNGKTPSNAELATAANWSRVYDNKLIKLVRFDHKLA